MLNFLIAAIFFIGKIIFGLVILVPIVFVGIIIFDKIIDEIINSQQK